MMRRTGWVGIVCCSLLILTGGAWAQQLRELPEAKIVARQGNSALVRAGGQTILLLQGTHYEIGYAYGKLLTKPLKKSLEGVLKIAQAADKKKKVKGSTLETIYKATNKYIPEKYKEELKGLAEGAGLPLHQVELANLFPEMFHCSTFAMSDKATKDGRLIHGRILDYAVGTKTDLQKTAVVIVIRPEGQNAIMMGSYIGLLGCITGMNDKQLAVGMVGMGNYGKWEGFPMCYLLRSVLDESDTLDEALPKFKQAKRTCQYGYVISDGKTKTAAGVHATPAAANIFRQGEAYKLWPLAIPDCVVISGWNRYTELVARIRKHYGKIDVETTLEMMTRPVAMECNLHNAVMLPSDGVMYFSNAAVEPTKKTQACYQPYYKYDLNVLLKMMDELKKGNDESTKDK
jgi:predicted choloylglycine hydrolase